MFPTHQERGVPNAEAEGRLTERDDCLFLTTTGGGTDLLLWPDSLRPATDRKGLVILGEDDEVVARVGQRVVLGGGYVDRRVAAGLVDIPLPAECEGTGYWLVSEIEPTAG